jgi:hypothetical protein
MEMVVRTFAVQHLVTLNELLDKESTIRRDLLGTRDAIKEVKPKKVKRQANWLFLGPTERTDA